MIFMVGCGNGNSSQTIFTDNQDTSYKINMKIGEKYEVKKKYTIEKKADDTIIDMEIDLKDQKTYITLKKGVAELVY